MSSVKGISSFSKEGIKWVRSDRRLPEDDLYIRWGCTADVPSNKVINTAKAIHLVNDKIEFRRIMNPHGLCPRTWFTVEDVPEDVLAKGVVVRKRKHSQGRGLWTTKFKQGLYGLHIKLGEGNYYISELIQKVAEYRVCVAQGRAVWVVKKTPSNPEDIAWNVAKGGRFDNIRWKEWPLKVVKTAIKGFNLSGLDFGGVDVMVDAEGKCYILEINSAPSLTSPYRQECMAKVFDYMVLNGKEPIPLVKELGGYKKFIHPALCESAKLVE